MSIPACTHLADLVIVVGDIVRSLEGSHGVAAYMLIVGGLVAGAFGVPVPEEAVLAVGGALASSGRASWVLVYALAWVVVLLLDLMLHGLGARFGPSIVRSRLGRRIPYERWSRVRDFIERRGLGAVVTARFVMGTRIPVFMLAGAMGMPRARFLAASGAAGLVSAAIPTTLGYLFAAHVDDVLDALGSARWVLLGGVLVLVLCWALRRRP